MNQATILIVDDEQSIVTMLETTLHKEGCKHVYKAYTGKEALALVQRVKFDFIVLDVMLPDTTGFDLCPIIRTHTNAYILFLTAKVSDLDKLTGFAIGADDYITKPFNPLEIAARIKARIRRTGKNTNNELEAMTPTPVESGLFSFGNFTIDERAGELKVGGKLTNCPAQVFHLLVHFCKHPNQVFSKEQLFSSVWGADVFLDDNTVMVHIRRLRERIEVDPGNPKQLITVRGLGYKLLKEPRHENN
ncbi:response regulator transcription factor [Alkalicoccobacillus murimartini]|uniref:DNA-binding response OmpR family regulator n=1 Tax=Alkalicoccobacillus murimartini TaxID=171685 RepID=A0ABT9YCA2_9BACI|nr:response regulator transcription factor [Alkalicoccobacillus murimartini]MDQ0205442.1 DNA-binding response OmpR family regulator [Alkalicoccobacillus murimartini]